MKDYIEDSDLDPLGERSCYHVALQGNLIALPTTSFVSDVVPYRMGCTRKEQFYVPTAHVRGLYRDNSVMENWGPVFLNGGSYYRRFPDVLDNVRENRNSWVRCSKIGSSYLLESYTEYRIVNSYWNPLNLWTTSYSTNTYYVDVEKRLVSTDGGRRWSSIPTLKNTFIQPPRDFSRYDFPTDLIGIENLLTRFSRNFIVPADDLVYGDLARRCANDAVVVDSNSIELLIELRNLAETLKGVASLATGRVNLKNLGSAYLSYKYGLRLTVKDLKSIISRTANRLLQSGRSIGRSRSRETFNIMPKVGTKCGTLSIVYNYKMTYYTHTDDWRDAIRTWFDTGLFPSLTNAWDLIPFSFVIDWFFSVEKHLNAIDANTYWSTYALAGVLYSKKETYHDVSCLFSLDGWTFAGDVTAKRYSRVLASVAHKPLFFDPSPREFHNYAELTSLFLVNKR